MITKSKIFYGGRSTGKSRAAREIIEEAGPDKCCFIDMTGIRDYSPFLFQDCDENTELIIMDNCRPGFNPISVLADVNDNTGKHTITVEQPGKKPFQIDAHFILIYNERPLYIDDDRIKRRAEFHYFFNSSVKIN